jgi:ABC-type multidrug transport system fused ATPase/permease subunit
MVNFEGDKRPESNAAPGENLQTDGGVELQDVKFCYPSKADVPVLKGVSIEVR